MKFMKRISCNPAEAAKKKLWMLQALLPRGPLGTSASMRFDGLIVLTLIIVGGFIIYEIFLHPFVNLLPTTGLNSTQKTNLNDLLTMMTLVFQLFAVPPIVLVVLLIIVCLLFFIMGGRGGGGQ